MLASQVAKHASAITDNSRSDYETISQEWLQSNPEGFAKWFESRLRMAADVLQKRVINEAVASIDDLKTWQWKMPLQSVVQILKRHRDVMFKDRPDSKPISVIITTLSGRAYRGENTIADALEGVLERMDSYINDVIPLVPNPVNPKEDFADKWYDQAYAKDKLQESFEEWLDQARIDFAALRNQLNSLRMLQSLMKTRLGLDFSDEKILGRGLYVQSDQPYTPPRFEITSAHKPWLPRST